MKRLQDNEVNPNTKQYWNHVYGDAEKRAGYALHGTPVKQAGVVPGKPTGRFQRALDEIQDGQKVLDIGCGVGVFTSLVKTIHPNCEVWGTDISSQACKDNTLENPTIHYRNLAVGNLGDLPLGSFDVVFSGETLEHLDDPHQLFRDAYQCLKRGGKFILTTPNGLNIQSPEHMWAFDHDDVADLFHGAGFERVRFIYLPDMEHLFVIMAVGYKK
jgi:2-polyprenyl-3-methyl-5-hydroxy-6-metoxy-1,4-benzoquinol methylase